MASHTLHPDTHTDGLADGCPRCDQHAVHPLESLDETNITALKLRVLDNLPPRSDNERLAMRKVKAAIEAAPHIVSWEE